MAPIPTATGRAEAEIRDDVAQVVDQAECGQYPAGMRW